MIRFILNFIFFGLLFYAISFYFPDAFESLLTAAKTGFAYLREFVQMIGDRLNSISHSTTATPPPVTVPATTP